MKQYEKVIILMAVLIVIVVIGSFINITIPSFSKKPSFEFSSTEAMKTTMSNERCSLVFNATLSNKGGIAKGVSVEAEAVDLSGRPVNSTIIYIGDLESGDSTFITDTMIANKNCSEIARVKLEIESYE